MTGLNASFPVAPLPQTLNCPPITRRFWHLLPTSAMLSAFKCPSLITGCTDFPQNEITAHNLQASPSLYQLIGDIYAMVRLPDQAESSYKRMLSLAQALHSDASEAGADISLAELSGQDNAKAYLQSALTLYQNIGDTSNVAETQSLIAQLLNSPTSILASSVNNWSSTAIRWFPICGLPNQWCKL